MSIRSVLAVAVVWRWRRVWTSRKPRPEEFSFSGAMRNDRQQQNLHGEFIGQPCLARKKAGGHRGWGTTKDVTGPLSLSPPLTAPTVPSVPSITRERRRSLQA